ncbi:hypothetical protein [Hydrogenimonas sp.]
MRKRKTVKLIHEGKYAAEVEVELIDTDEGWSPYLSLEDAKKLDRLRKLLADEAIDEAKKLAKIYRLEPIEAA